MIFLTAAQELGVSPDSCFVIEDATSGVQAAKAGGMAAIGVARLGDEGQLATAGADLVVTTLDDVSVPALGEGRLQERRAAAEIRRRRTERPPSVWTLVYDGFDPEQGPARDAVRAGQRVFRDPWRASRSAGRRCQLPGHIRRRPLQPAGQRRRWPSGRERGPGQRPQLAAAAVPDRRRSMVRPPAGRGLPIRAGHAEWARLPAGSVGETARAGGPAWFSDGSSAEGTSTWPVSRRSSRPRTGPVISRCAPDWTAGSSTRVCKRYRDLNGRHLRTLGHAQVDRETVDLQSETTQSRVRVALAARTRLLRDGEPAEVDRQLVEEPGFVAQQLTFRLEQERPATVEKIVALYTSRPRNRREPSRRAAGAGGRRRFRDATRPSRARLAHRLGPVRHCHG